MLEIASQMILCLLLAALLGFIIGYLFGKMTCAKDDCGEVAASQHKGLNDSDNIHTLSSTEGTKTSSHSPSPILLSAPRNGQKDNLTRIKGIGMKIEETLNEIGIYHFDQIAGWNDDNIAWADDTLGFPGRANREEWVMQAKALALGKETEFSKRVDAGEVDSSKQS